MCVRLNVCVAWVPGVRSTCTQTSGRTAGGRVGLLSGDNGNAASVNFLSSR